MIEEIVLQLTADVYDTEAQVEARVRAYRNGLERIDELLADGWQLLSDRIVNHPSGTICRYVWMYKQAQAQETPHGHGKTVRVLREAQADGPSMS